MTIRAALISISLVVGMASARGEEPAGAKADGRVVEGMVVAAGRVPVEGARVLFGQPGRGLLFVEGATAKTDAQGRYRADLSKFPWSTSTMRALVLAPGYKVVERTVEAGERAVTADFKLAAQRWKEKQVRLEDVSGRPVIGVEVTCSVGHGVIWARPKTDTEGRCRIAIPLELGMGLSAEPQGALPIETYLGGSVL